MATGGNMDWRIGRNVVQCNKYMLDHEVEGDVTFVVGGEEIRAHRYMLISRSAVFQSQLTHQRMSQEIQVEDIEPHIFKKMLQFIYTDDVDFNFSSAMKLFKAASKYGIEDLKKLCFNKMKENISKENVCPLLKMAYDTNCQSEKDRVLNVFYRDAEELLSSEGIFELPQKCLIDIFKSDRITLTEEKKFDVSKLWAESLCRRQNREVNDRNIKELLAPVVDCIKFEKMDMEYFTNHVSNTEILDPTKIISIFQKLVKCKKTLPLASNERSATVNQSQSSPTTESPNGLQAMASQTSQIPSTSVLQSSSILQLETDPYSSSEHVLASGRQGPTPIPPRGNNNLNRSRAQPARRSSSTELAGAQPFQDAMIENTVTLWRFGGILSGKAYLRDNPDAISIIPSHSGNLHGIYLFGSHQRQGSYKVNLKILEDGAVKKAIPNKEFVSDGRQKYHLIRIDPPMHFDADGVYTVEMVMKGPTSFYGKSGKEMVTEEDVTFTFIPNDNGLNGTNTSIGQFPGFVFEKDE